MKNKFLVILGVIILFFALRMVYLGQSDQVEQEVLKSTYDVSKEYIWLRYRTDNILTKAKEYKNYETWDKDMTKLVQDWEKLESVSLNLEEDAKREIDSLALNFKYIDDVRAYTSKEITAIYDKAPRFKGIATLAKHLGVDAKRAQLILNQAQDSTSADVFIEEGDTFENLENTAIVVKDGCKVTGFVGGVMLTGGAAGFAAAGTITQATVVISGVDLALEVTEDSAQIAFGDKNKISSFVKDVRTVTEPIATVMTITNMPGRVGKGLERLDTALFGLEQFRDAVQEGKVVGIDLTNFKYNPSFQVIRKTKYPGELTVAEMEKVEVEAWLESLNKKHEPMTKEEVENFLANSKDNSENANIAVEENKEKVVEVNNIVGTAWKGSLESMSGGDEQKRTIDFDFVINEDGSVSGNNFKKWKQVGDRIKLYGEDESEGYFEFKIGKNDLLLTKIFTGNELVQPGEAYMGGIAPGGFLYRKSDNSSEESLSTGEAMPISEFNELNDGGKLSNISEVIDKLGEPDVKTTDDKGRTVYVYFDLVKYSSGNLGSVRFAFYNEEDYKTYIENMGASWESNKENWDRSGGGIKATTEIKGGNIYKDMYRQ